eukprot:scaffold2552_cov380-Prasinococcus_capsulatus_cf.AAC.42
MSPHSADVGHNGQPTSSQAVRRGSVTLGGHCDGCLTLGDGEYAMLLCRVILGRVGRGRGNLRKAPDGCQSVSQSGWQGPEEIYATFLEAQAYPLYIIKYKRVTEWKRATGVEGRLGFAPANCGPDPHLVGTAGPSIGHPGCTKARKKVLPWHALETGALGADFASQQSHKRTR